MLQVWLACVPRPEGTTGNCYILLADMHTPRLARPTHRPRPHTPLCGSVRLGAAPEWSFWPPSTLTRGGPITPMGRSTGCSTPLLELLSQRNLFHLHWARLTLSGPSYPPRREPCVPISYFPVPRQRDPVGGRGETSVCFVTALWRRAAAKKLACHCEPRWGWTWNVITACVVFG